jgi:hypothetical protein
MPHPLSSLGIVHTAVSIVPVVLGAAALLRHGRIDPSTRVGKLYVVAMLPSILTSFGLSSTGGFNPGHALGLIALVLLLVGTLAHKVRAAGRAADYVQTISLSASFLILLIPGTNETLTRLPTSHPLASGPESPQVQVALLGLFVLFLVGSAWQVLRLRARRS